MKDYSQASVHGGTMHDRSPTLLERRATNGLLRLPPGHYYFVVEVDPGNVHGAYYLSGSGDIAKDRWALAAPDQCAYPVCTAEAPAKEVMMTNRNLIIGGIVVVIVAVAAYFLLTARDTTPPQQSPPAKTVPKS